MRLLRIIGYSGAVIGFSTFGPAIAVGLGLWDDTTAASLAFSGTLAFSGIVGTPVGGVLLDAWVQHDVSAVSRSTGDANTRRLTRALDLSLALCSFGAIVIANAAYARRAVVFLVYMGMGTLPLFAATAAMNVAVFESVPRCHIAPIWRGRSIYETVFSCKNFIFYQIFNSNLFLVLYILFQLAAFRIFHTVHCLSLIHI